MKITGVETIRSRRQIPLPEPWLAAWREPQGEPTTGLGFSVYKVHTDAGITGIGPATGYARLDGLVGSDPLKIGAFREAHMSGRRSGNADQGAAGIEIALWDIVGKASGQPVYKLLGAHRDRLPVYAATSRLLAKEAHVDQVQELVATGFKAVKLRLHRPDPRDDLAVVAAVRDAVGHEVTLLVDANQNNASPGYAFWSRRTALEMAKQLDALDVYYLEEPLPRRDVEGLAEIADAVGMFIAGGEHTPTVYDFMPHLTAGAFDIVQPDVILGGNFGITGLRDVATVADQFDRLICPHVLGTGITGLALPATLHAMAAVPNCPMVEYPMDPPVLTAETTQALVTEPIQIDEDGCVAVPDRPGIGVELNEEGLADNLVFEED